MNPDRPFRKLTEAEIQSAIDELEWMMGSGNLRHAEPPKPPADPEAADGWLGLGGLDDEGSDEPTE